MRQVVSALVVLASAASLALGETPYAGNSSIRSFTHYSGTNQLGSETGVASYAYDARGNRSSYAGPSGTYTYSYDLTDNLTGVLLSGNSLYTASYDATGKRVTAVTSTTTTHYLYNPDGELIAEVNGSGAPVARYTWGPGGPISRIAGANRRYYLLDGLGNVRFLASKQAGITDRYTYDAWGNVITSQGLTPNALRWCGEFGYEWVPATGLYHVGAREYDPKVGRWLQRDPLGPQGGDPNVYAYVRNRPTTHLDNGGREIVAILETALDVGSLAWDLGRLAFGDDETREEANKDLAIDTACLFIPYVNSVAIKACKGAVKLIQRMGTLNEKICLPAGTLVLTTTGPLPIEQIQPGMLVVARSDTGGDVPVLVESADSHTAEQLLQFSFNTGNSVASTPQHPFYRLGSGWTHAEHLSVGDQLQTQSLQVTITAIQAVAGPVTVYRLSVADPHNYFVGDDAVLVHNKWLIGLIYRAIKNALVHHDDFAKMARIRELGRAGEAAANVTGPKKAIRSLTGTATRIPDEVNKKTLLEVENCAFVTVTKQLEDYRLWAKKKGLDFILAVRDLNGVSDGLIEWAEKGWVEIVELPLVRRGRWK